MPDELYALMLLQSIHDITQEMNELLTLFNDTLHSIRAQEGKTDLYWDIDMHVTDGIIEFNDAVNAMQSKLDALKQKMNNNQKPTSK